MKRKRKENFKLLTKEKRYDRLGYMILDSNEYYHILPIKRMPL